MDTNENKRLGGVRPSSGAAMTRYFGTSDFIGARSRSNIAAPEDGRSNDRVFRCVRFHWSPLAFQHRCARGRAHSDKVAALSLPNMLGEDRAGVYPPS